MSESMWTYSDPGTATHSNALDCEDVKPSQDDRYHDSESWYLVGNAHLDLLYYG